MLTRRASRVEWRQRNQEAATVTEEQYEFDFPGSGTPPGCKHVTPRGTDGFLLDGQVRVCGHECAETWARKRGHMLSGEYVVRERRGKGVAVVSRQFFSSAPTNSVQHTQKNGNGTRGS